MHPLSGRLRFLDFAARAGRFTRNDTLPMQIAPPGDLAQVGRFIRSLE
jgi:hypothetical protein